MSLISRAHLLWPTFALWKRGSQRNSSLKTSASCSKEPSLISFSTTKRCAFLLVWGFSWRVCHSVTGLGLGAGPAGGSRGRRLYRQPGSWNERLQTVQTGCVWVHQAVRGGRWQQSEFCSLSVRVTCQKIFARFCRLRLWLLCFKDSLLLTETSHTDEQTRISKPINPVSKWSKLLHSLLHAFCCLIDSLDYFYEVKGLLV